MVTELDTLEAKVGDLTTAELEMVAKWRGGCSCSHPNTLPPCSVCTTPLDEEEMHEVLEQREGVKSEEPPQGWGDW